MCTCVLTIVGLNSAHYCMDNAQKDNARVQYYYLYIHILQRTCVYTYLIESKCEHVREGSVFVSVCHHQIGCSGLSTD